MEKLLALLSVVQLTKQQPLTGYSVAGVKLAELPTLAEHHYTSALAAMFASRHIKKLGGNIDPEKIVAMLLIHDLGELFGGDISTPLSRTYPELREYKNKIGERAIDLMTKELPDEIKNDFLDLYYACETKNSDEYWVVKFFDQLDHQLFLEHYNFGFGMPAKQDNFRNFIVDEHIGKLLENISDKITHQYLQELFTTYKEKFYKRGFIGLNELLS